jgi:hypothetical protein
MDFVKNTKKISNILEFREIDKYVLNIDSFNKYNLNNIKRVDQLFRIIPPYELVNDILLLLTNKELNTVKTYKFSRKIIINKNILENIKIYIPELKKYYLKCKHSKYLENLDDKKIITLFRQIVRPYEFSIRAIEKYSDGHKYLLYILEKNIPFNNTTLKKINSTLSFD